MSTQTLSRVVPAVYMSVQHIILNESYYCLYEYVLVNQDFLIIVS